jgi:uncharacterized phage-associated protein
MVPKPDGTGFIATVPKLDGTDDESKNARAVIDRVIEVYGRYSATKLSAMTHAPGSPWSQTWEQMGAAKRFGKAIDDDLIKQYFCKLIKPK